MMIQMTWLWGPWLDNFRPHLLLGVESPWAPDPVLPGSSPRQWVPRTSGPQQEQHLPLPQDLLQWGPPRLWRSVHSPGRRWSPNDLLVSSLLMYRNVNLILRSPWFYISLELSVFKWAQWTMNWCQYLNSNLVYKLD